MAPDGTAPRPDPAFPRRHRAQPRPRPPQAAAGRAAQGAGRCRGARGAGTRPWPRSTAARERRAAQAPRPTFDDSLPVAREAETLVDLIRKHPVVILAGETGSGKTTQLPKLCLAAGRGSRRHDRLHPAAPHRRAHGGAARGRGAEAAAGRRGRLPGALHRTGRRRHLHQVHDRRHPAGGNPVRPLPVQPTTPSSSTRRTSAASTSISCSATSSSWCRRRPDLKLIVTSATIDTERFARHFDGAPVVKVEGRTYPVEVRYRPARWTRERGQNASGASATAKPAGQVA